MDAATYLIKAAVSPYKAHMLARRMGFFGDDLKYVGKMLLKKKHARTPEGKKHFKKQLGFASPRQERQMIAATEFTPKGYAREVALERGAGKETRLVRGRKGYAMMEQDLPWGAHSHPYGLGKQVQRRLLRHSKAFQKHPLLNVLPSTDLYGRKWIMEGGKRRALPKTLQEFIAVLKKRKPSVDLADFLAPMRSTQVVFDPAARTQIVMKGGHGKLKRFYGKRGTGQGV